MVWEVMTIILSPYYRPWFYWKTHCSARAVSAIDPYQIWQCSYYRIIFMFTFIHIICMIFIMFYNYASISADSTLYHDWFPSYSRMIFRNLGHLLSFIPLVSFPHIMWAEFCDENNFLRILTLQKMEVNYIIYNNEIWKWIE